MALDVEPIEELVVEMMEELLEKLVEELVVELVKELMVVTFTGGVEGFETMIGRTVDLATSFCKALVLN